MAANDIMTRMKENYEFRSRTYLTRRTPVIIRLDGKAFHTYTKGLTKPFDFGLTEDMQKAAIFLCNQIQGAKCAYTQSDEISILVTDYEKITTDAWFNYNVQKMTSVSASMCTAKFNELRSIRYDEESRDHVIFRSPPELAFFDARVFSIPKEEVANYFLARQQDAVKNSISMLAQSLFSHQALHKKNSSDMQEMCFRAGHNWNDLATAYKRGSFIRKVTYWNGKPVVTNKDGLLTNGELYIGDDGAFYSLAVMNKQRTPPIRTKWEVDTPFKFTQEIFNSYL